MLTSISWTQYAAVVVGLLVLYYAYVGAVYYRAELLGLLKGKAGGVAPAPAAPARQLASLIGRAPLIAAPPAPPPASAAPAVPLPIPGLEGAPVGEEVDDLPALDLPAAEVIEKFNDEIDNFYNKADSNTINFTQQNTENDPQGTGIEIEPALAEVEPDFSVGVVQLGNYLSRAGKGELSQAELVEQVPVLANTDLLVACFQASVKSARNTTARLFADVAEPSAG